MSVMILKDGQLVEVDDQVWSAENPLEPPKIPQVISRLQGQLALNSAGLLPQVNAAVAAADTATQIWYADALNWERSDPVLLAMATAVGLSPAQVDELFVQAAGL